MRTLKNDPHFNLIFAFIFSVVFTVVLALASVSGARTVQTAKPTSKPALDPLPDASVNALISFEDFLVLTKENQEYYLLGVQRLMLEIEKDDEALHTQYQSAQSSLLLDWLFPTADAAAGGDDRRCVYAGWVSEMDINGTHCMTPPGHCSERGKIQCNPMLYGNGKCVAATRGATAACERSKKNPADVAAEIRAKGSTSRQAWSNMRGDIGSYCANPRSTQVKVCTLIRNRLARLDRVIGRIPKAQYVAHVGRRASAHSARETTSVRSEEVASSSDSTRSTRSGDTVDTSESGGTTVVVAPPTARADRTPVKGAAAPELRLTRTSGACVPASLLANLKPESIANAAPMNYMSLETARMMMCSVDPLPDWLIPQQQALITTSLRRVTGSDKYANADRRNYAGVLSNFNACLRDAQTLRRTGAGTVSGDFATLQVDGNFVRMNDENNQPIVGLGSVFDEEGLLRGKGISICNLQTSDNVVLAPVYSSGHAAPAASSGAAQ